MYKVETQFTFPHEHEIYEVTKDGAWYASFAYKDEADNYAEFKNMFNKARCSMEMNKTK